MTVATIAKQIRETKKFVFFTVQRDEDGTFVFTSRPKRFAINLGIPGFKEVRINRVRSRSMYYQVFEKVWKK